MTIDIDEIERSARALLAADPDDFEAASREFHQAANAADVLTLTAELRRLRDDAERYRWARNTPICIGRNGILIQNVGDRLDAAIDAARKEKA
jgi:hypothetical protein